ncbi:type VI secretion protein [Rubrivivax gelatinosus]|nr:type VI secretion protein [Rubrivivax gelatinosus]
MHSFKRLILTALAGTLPLAGNAQGIPVIDRAGLTQSIQQVLHAVTQIRNQVSQLTELQNQLASMSGSRMLGTVANDPSLRQYVPADAYRQLNEVDNRGYAGLSPTARALRDAGMAYNCLELDGDARVRCQAVLAQPYQHKGMLQDAMVRASGRIAQIQTLMNRVDSTSDQKGALEIQARIGAENAQLAHELTQIQMLQATADSEERIARSRDRERQYQMLGRTGRVSDFLP